MRLSLAAFALLPLLAACAATDNAAEQAARARECAIYFSIDGYLKETERATSTPVAKGCPPQYNNIADFSGVGDGNELTGSTSDRLYARMLERGVPEDVAVIVRRSHAFRDWVKLTQAAR